VCAFSFLLGRFVNDDVEGRRTRGASTVWRTERYATAIRKSNRIFRLAVFLVPETLCRSKIFSSRLRAEFIGGRTSACVYGNKIRVDFRDIRLLRTRRPCRRRKNNPISRKLLLNILESNNCGYLVVWMYFKTVDNSKTSITNIVIAIV